MTREADSRPSRPAPRLTGACLCGAVTYTVASRPLPLSTVVCNCKDCQRSSGSAFSVVVPVRTSAFQLTGAPLARFANTGTDSHERRERRFCATCGSQILSVLAEAPEVTWVKAGTLDDTSSVAPAVELWRSSAQAWNHGVLRRPRTGRGLPSGVLRAARPLLRALDRASLRGSRQRGRPGP